MFNKKHTEETKEKIRLKSLGNKHNLGRKHTEETKIKLRKPRIKGRTAWNKGKGKYKTKKDKERGVHLNKYGIDIEQYDIMLISQNYTCAICLKPEIKLHKNGCLMRLSVDHCHRTKKVRGLLCNKCNLALGHFDDNPYLCQRAAQYLLVSV